MGITRLHTDVSVEKPRHSWICLQIEQIGGLWNKRCWEVSSRVAAERRRSAFITQPGRTDERGQSPRSPHGCVASDATARRSTCN